MHVTVIVNIPMPTLVCPTLRTWASCPYAPKVRHPSMCGHRAPMLGDRGHRAPFLAEKNVGIVPLSGEERVGIVPLSGEESVGIVPYSKQRKLWASCPLR